MEKQIEKKSETKSIEPKMLCFIGGQMVAEQDMRVRDNMADMFHEIWGDYI